MIVSILLAPMFLNPNSAAKTGISQNLGHLSLISNFDCLDFNGFQISQNLIPIPPHVSSDNHHHLPNIELLERCMMVYVQSSFEVPGYMYRVDNCIATFGGSK